MARSSPARSPGRAARTPGEYLAVAALFQVMKNRDRYVVCFPATVIDAAATQVMEGEARRSSWAGSLYPRTDSSITVAAYPGRCIASRCRSNDPQSSVGVLYRVQRGRTSHGPVRPRKSLTVLHPVSVGTRLACFVYTLQQAVRWLPG